MTAEIGHLALVLALLLAAAQAVVPMVGAARGDPAMMALARPAAVGQFVFAAAALACLVRLFAVSDFSVALVAAHSHTAKPLLYKITGVWANHEGSMVLWVAVLALFGALVACFGANLPARLKARILAVQGAVASAFFAFVLFTSNPFLRRDPAPFEGQGLNPLLQDPGLAFHPPFLYLGYVGFSIAFSFAVAALLEGRVDPAWARWVRPWTLAAWCALTAGIALGSWWAYYELGWGGWWFWDPVENASFVPWLAGTALLHSAIVVERRGALKGWTVLLAILTFGFALLGTFLVRSGVLTSVHSFAADPARGVFILVLVAVVLGGGLALYAARAPALQGGGLFAPVSREGALVLNNLLLTTAAAVVLLGTLYPLVLDALGGGMISVGPPFFEATFVPVAAPLMAACAVGPLLAWKRGDLAGALGRLRAGALLALAVVAAAAWRAGAADAAAAFGLGLAAWLAAGAAVEFAGKIGFPRRGLAGAARRAARLPRSAWGMTAAHAGLAVAVAGMVASSAWQTERILSMTPGQSTELAGWRVVFDGVGERRGPNWRAVAGRFRLMDGDRRAAMLRPEKRSYPVEGGQTTEAAIHTTWLADVYVVLGERSQSGAWTVRLYHNPLVPWIWIGAAAMAAGGLVSLTDRRLRVGAPRRARAPAGAAA